MGNTRKVISIFLLSSAITFTIIDFYNFNDIKGYFWVWNLLYLSAIYTSQKDINKFDLKNHSTISWISSILWIISIIICIIYYD